MRTSPTLVGVALLAGSLALAAPAGAASRKPPIANGGMKSSLGAGYVTTPPPGTGVTVGEAEFRVPKIKCASSTDLESLWLGVEAYEGTAGTGADDLYAQVEALCSDGTISYRAQADAPGVAAAAPVAVTPGEVIDTYIRDSASGSVLDVFEIEKKSAVELISLVGAAPTNGLGYEQSLLVGHQVVNAGNIPTFHDITTNTNTVHFISSYVNGYEMGADGYPTTEINQALSHVEIVTSKIGGPRDGAFTLTFKSHF